MINKQIVKQRWNFAFGNNKFKTLLVSALVMLIIQLIFISIFQSHIEMRPGVQFKDPLLGNIPPMTLNTLTFFSIYLTHLIAIIAALMKPEMFLRLVIGYFFVYFFRIFALFLLPLDPPISTIPLIDPILITFGGGEIITKDLFYSGHTSATFMALLTTENKKIKSVMGIGLLLTMFGVLFQRVHYTIDVYVALFFAYTAFRVSKVFVRKQGLSNLSSKI